MTTVATLLQAWEKMGKALDPKGLDHTGAFKPAGMGPDLAKLGSHETLNPNSILQDMIVDNLGFAELLGKVLMGQGRHEEAAEVYR